MQDFVHLHVHTYYSILDGQSPIPKLVDKAVADGMRGMAVTDHGNMFGIKEFFNYCGKVNAKRTASGQEPFKPIIGCEMYVARRDKEQKDSHMGDRSGYHLIVLAKNKKGYHNLIKLVSRSWMDGFYLRPRTDRKDLRLFHEGLIVCSACLAGEVPAKILNGDIEGAREAIEWYHGIWGDDYYLELQRHEVKDPQQWANRETYAMQQQVNGVLMELAREYGVKLVCTNDCHFVDEENAEAHDRLLCLSTGKDLDDSTRMLYSKQEWFKTREEMNGVFADVPEALANTCEILDKVEVYDINNAPIMPIFPIPREFGSEEEYRRRITEQELYDEFTSDENGENPMPEAEGRKKIEKLGGYDRMCRIKLEADYLAKLSYDGARKIYGDPIPNEVEERMRFELHVMKTMGFPGYFLIVQDFINTARDNLGVWVGPGRGSAAGSVVAYCLGITKIDPLKYDLLFERFLNPGRISLPDIDTDFDDDGRGRVLQYVMDKYGKENCAHIITYSTMATKNALRDVARVEKVPLEVSNRWCKAIPDRLPNDPNTGKSLKMNLTNVVKYVPELREAEASPDNRERNTIKYAKQLEGTVRGTGIHACGFIICRDPISDHVPVSTADDPDFPDTKTTVTQYDGHVIEETGLIKMDFLGLKTLSEQKEAVKNIKLTRGIDIDLDRIPIDDPETYKLYQEGRTIGTFQFESSGMQRYLKELHPTVFEDLIAMNALYRPGPMDYIPAFIARKRDPSKIKYDIPCMEQYLKDTYGITVYQEQVMLLSRQLGGLTLAESDSLRKAMGKKKKDIVDQMKPKFIEGGKKNGYDTKVLEKIWGDWEKFASYAFNKSHAACYSWVAYQTAWLKAHYPAEFMAAVMTRRKNDVSEIEKLMGECKSMGIDTLVPDVNESFGDFGVNKKGEIRFGLAAIKGMGTAAAEAIMNERNEHGLYKDIFDFARRIDYSQINRKCMESLVLSGALDNLGVAREQFFVQVSAKGDFLDALIRFGQSYQSTVAEAQNSLFGFESMNEAIALPKIPAKYDSWSSTERLKREKDLLSVYLSAHPLEDFSIVLKSMCNTHCSELSDREKLAKKQSVVFGGIVTATRTGITKRNQTPYGVVTLEDFDGQGELAVYDNWGAWSGYFTEGAILYVTATVRKYENKKNNTKYYELRITGIQYMSEVMEKNIGKFTIAINTDSLTADTASDLTDIIKESPGEVPLYFQINDNRTNFHTLLRAKLGISISSKLVNFIETRDNLKYLIN